MTTQKSQRLAHLNTSLKQSLSTKTESLVRLLQTLKKHKLPVSNHVQCMDQNIDLMGTLNGRLGKHLIDKQIEANNSVQFGRLVKQYEAKVFQLRMKLQSKQRQFEELLETNESIFPESCYLPTPTHLRKFFVQTIYKQKMHKTVETLKVLQDELHQSSKITVESESVEYCKKLLNAKVKERLTEKLLIKIQKEDKRENDLKERYLAYRGILKMLDGEKKQILKDKKEEKVYKYVKNVRA